MAITQKRVLLQEEEFLDLQRCGPRQARKTGVLADEDVAAIIFRNR